MAEAYSIRESLQGALHDFVRESGFEDVHLEEIIRELVGLLASYREEDSPLFPEVFVFSSANGLTAIAPSTTQMTLGSMGLAAPSANTIVKNCAPLATGGWAVFVVKEDERLRFGLFRAIRHALALGAEESMLDLGKEEPVMLIRNCGHLTVELRNGSGAKYHAALTTAFAKASLLETHVGKFVAATTDAVADANDVRAYLRRFLTSALQRCHGTLLAVVGTEQLEREPTLKDGLWLMPPVPLADLNHAALKATTADALADLTAAEALVKGMINSDGVVLFGDDGRIMAFRVFLKAKDDEVLKLPDSGGGRRRTYELMRLRLGAPFRAVFFRSQDGETQCEGLK